MENELRRKIKERFGYDVDFTTVNKNGIEKKAVVVNAGTLRPTIYYDGLSVNQVLSAIENNIDTTTDASQVTDWNYAKNNLFLRVVNKDHKSYYSQFIHKSTLDVILIPYIKLSMEGGEGTINVTESLLKKLGVSEEELFKTAQENERNDFSLQGLLPFLQGFTDIPDDMINNCPFIIATRSSGKNLSAGAIFGSKDNQKKVFEKFKKKYFVIPSSIHETLVMPDNGDDVNYLKQMISEVNANEVLPEEVLSNSLYIFDGKELSLA